MARIEATYRIHGDARSIDSRARAISIEQTVEVPLEAIREERILREVAGAVLAIEAAGTDLFDVTIGYDPLTGGGEPAQFLNVLFGNSSLQPNVELIDFTVPDSLIGSLFAGPQFGLAGIRERFAIPERPITATALKPMGLRTEELARLCATFARAGIDIIKDDHGLADQSTAPFKERVLACRRAVADVESETGHRARYFPNLSGTPAVLHDRLAFARDAGVDGLLMAPMLIGLPVFHELVAGAGLPVLAHPAFGGALRIAPECLFGKLFRLFGADASIFPNYGGRFSYSSGTCRRIAENLRDPAPGLRAALPAPAGGMSLERVDEIIDFYGSDVILLIGGSLLMTGDILARSRALVDGVRARHEATLSSEG